MTPPSTRGHRLRLGTRGSTLARRQSELVAAALRQAGHDVELVTVVTEGDVRPPDTAWGEGAFVGALERALLAGEVDLAVHSAKDVPIDAEAAAAALVIAAYPGREDARDALVLSAGAPGSRRGMRGPGPAPGGGLESLPQGARVGTDSPRRGGFLRAARPDLVIVPLHGNVDTRLRRLDAGEVDALVLAVAGLVRLGHADRAGLPLDPATVPPAPGQGALAIQCRADDPAVFAAVAAHDDPAARLAVEVEREVLRVAGGGCRAPLGALASLRDGRVHLLAGALGTAGRPLVFRASDTAARWRELAASAASDLLDGGFRGQAA